MVDRKLVDECVHCGFCLPACPTYRSWGQEMDSPRGRIQLMKAVDEGRQALSASVVRHFDRCLGCLACVSACPSGVRYDTLIEQARADVEETFERPRTERLIRGLLFAIFPHASRLRLLLALRRLLSLSGLRWLAARLGAFRLLPSRLRQLEALAPDVSLRRLLSRPPSQLAASGEPRRRVALLPGCVQSVAFPEVNLATARVLAAEGCDVVVPRGLGCCGALSTHAGRREEARAFARRAIAAFEAHPADVIVVNAAGCGAALKHLPRLFANDASWLPRARALAAKVKDVCELLAELEPRSTRHPLSERAAYHDACHLSHGQGVSAEPRRLLSAVPGLELCEVPDADQCCGSAGIYNLLEPESAELIGRRKAENVALVEASLLISANPGCSLQIQRHLGETGRKIRVAHPVEVLDASIRGVPLREA